MRLLEEAYRHGTRPHVLYHAPAMLSRRGLELVRKFEAGGVQTARVSASDLSRMTNTETSPGVLAVFAMPGTELTQLYRPQMRNVLLCEDLSDPGNVGTLCRSALAFGFDLVILCGKCAEPYAPKVVRSSVGAVFGISVALASPTEALKFAAQEGFAIVAAEVSGRNRLASVLPRLRRRKVLLVMGSEAEGLSSRMLKMVDYSVRIWHERGVESLNTAVAGSILMKECYEYRHRRNVQ